MRQASTTGLAPKKTNWQKQTYSRLHLAQKSNMYYIIVFTKLYNTDDENTEPCEALAQKYQDKLLINKPAQTCTATKHGQQQANFSPAE